MELRGKKVLVVGLGKSGIAAARLLLAQGARVIANDQRPRSELGADVAALEAQGTTLALGGHDPVLFTGVDLIVVSPGVPPLPALQTAERAGVPIASEIELASWFVEGTLIGITGTNGKSTVTTLVGKMCERSGRPTFVGGNLGTPLTDVAGSAAAQRGGYAVVELSSFQLERVDSLHVNVAALLNVTEDHLDRYPSLQAYAEAKAAIFRNQTPEDAAVVAAGDALCESLAQQARGRVFRFGGKDGAVRVAQGALLDTETGLRVPLSEIALSGRHNHDNACAAALVARLAGVSPEHIAVALREFRGLPHRMQHVRSLAGVDYFDDSKATNVGATVAALDGLSERAGRVVLIAGGRHKGGDYAPMAARLSSRARAVVLLGEAAPLIEAALRGGGYPLKPAANMEEAVRCARSLARPGDAVLLAPACSSFDMFKSYAERGDLFQQAVRALPGGDA
ncbi:MAG: UDP-N-acetylmuramoyl-L-alanine--D-glutamate ligase [Polyangiales bacterium]